MNAAGQANQLNQFYGTGALGGDTSQLFRLLMQSPMWQQMAQQASLQGTQLGQGMTAGLAQRGLTGTGVGTIANSMASAAPQFMLTNMQGDLWQKALMAALQNQQGRLGAFTTLEQQRRSQPGPLGSIFGGLLGAAGSAVGMGWNPFKGK